MRQIEFRGLRLDNKQWVYGGLILPPNSFRRFIGYIELMDSGGEVVIVHYDEVDPATVGEFPDILDKNSRKICEGDICSRINHHGKKEIGIVEYQDGCWFPNRRFMEQDTTWLESPKDFYDDCEIIGNIYENDIDKLRQS